MKINLIKQKNVPKAYHLGNVIYFYKDDVIAMVVKTDDSLSHPYMLIDLEKGAMYDMAETLANLYVQNAIDPGELINAELREVR